MCHLITAGAVENLGGWLTFAGKIVEIYLVGDPASIARLDLSIVEDDVDGDPDRREGLPGLPRTGIIFTSTWHLFALTLTLTKSRHIPLQTALTPGRKADAGAQKGRGGNWRRGEGRTSGAGRRGGARPVAEGRETTGARGPAVSLEGSSSPTSGERAPQGCPCDEHPTEGALRDDS